MNKLNIFRVAVSTAILLLSHVSGIRAEIEAPAALPSGYVDEPVTDVGGTPTGLALTPDGRLLITRQEGDIRVFKNGALLPATALDLTIGGIVCSAFERGIESVAVDPDFASNNHIYVYYTYAGSDNSCSSDSAEINRVSRYTMSGDSAGSETVILDNLDSPCGNHNGGSVNFDADGLLYVSVGDGGCTPERAQNRSVLNGKILRINRDGSIPSSNPFFGESGSVVCAASSFNPNGGVCREIFAYGLRNPFKMTFKEGANTLHINDVGQSAWEEINLGAAGANYGWSDREGFCVSGSTTDCGAPPSGMSNPIHAYEHASGLCSITGGAFSTNVWTGVYGDAYYFADWCGNNIYRLVPGTGGGYTRSTFHTSPDGGGISALLFDSAGNSLYYAQGGGSVRRIRYTGATGNRAPTAVASANATSGSTPLTVQFTGSNSSDPDGDALTYGWRFGDGGISNLANPSHTYSASGGFVATLVVTDTNGASSTPASVSISVGSTANTPPNVSITSPNTSFRFVVGRPVTLTASASDAQDGTLPGSALKWSVVLWHIPQALAITAHTHPFFSGTGYNVTVPSMPGPEDFDAAPLSHLEIRLTATDLQGLTRTVTQTLTPNRVMVGLATNPQSLTLTANSVTVTRTRQITAWQGMTLTLSAPNIQRSGSGNWLKFDRWSDSSQATHGAIVPASSVTYTVEYTPFVPSLVHLPLTRRP